VRTLALGLSPLSLACLCLACEPGPPRAEPRPGPVDKQDLYADPSLVPTRAGERARRELALAGELRKAIDLLGVGATQVDVELGGPRPRVIVVASAPGIGQAPHAQLRTTVETLALATVDNLRVEEVTVVLPTHDQAHLDDPQTSWTQDPRRGGAPLPIAIAIALLGLGLSAGVCAERLRLRL